MILFDDPNRSAAKGTTIYPDGAFLPEQAVMWGSLLNDLGDPLSPNYPSVGEFLSYFHSYFSPKSIILIFLKLKKILIVLI